MNMDGGYSFSDYTKELKEISNKVDLLVTEFKRAIVEYRDNYNAENYYAMRALEALNVYYDDDTGKNVGDLFLDTNTTDKQLHTIIMQGNTDNIDTIEKLLCFGLTEVSENTLLDRLPNVVIKTEGLDPNQANDRATVLSLMESVQTKLIDAENTYNGVIECGNDFNKYIEENKISEENIDYELEKYCLYDLAKNTTFGKTKDGKSGMTLLEAALLSQTEPDSNGKMFDAYMADVLVSAMTEGQRGVMGSVGLEAILINNYGYIYNREQGEEVSEEQEEKIDNNFETLEDVQQISVYAGVDRSLFSNENEDIALTSSSIRDSAMTGSNNFGVDTSKSWTDNHALKASMIVMSCIGAVASIVGATAIAAAKMTYKETIVKYTVSYKLYGCQVYTYSYDSKEVYDSTLKNIKKHPVHEIKNAGPITRESCCFGNYTSKLMTGLYAFEAIAAVVTVVFTVMALITNLYKPKEKEIEYSKIPRVLVDLKIDKNEVKSYFAYYAVGLINAKEGSTNTLELYGDLNGYNKKNPWTALYYSKDERLRTPLTVDMLIKKGDYTLSINETEQYQGIHSFSSTSATDLNEKNTKQGSPKIYVYLKKSVSSEVQNAFNVASLFNLENYLITGCSIVVGAAIAFAITYTVMKKKKEEISK